MPTKIWGGGGQGVAIPDLDIDPDSMVINSYEPQASETASGNSDVSANQIMDNPVEPELVLAIEAPPVNFLHLEILLETILTRTYQKHPCNSLA
jgi:hypothetical protein